MNVVWFLAIWVVIGIALAFVAFSGGPGRARQNYLTRGGPLVKVVIPILYVALGIAVPAIVFANGKARLGGTGPLVNDLPSKQLTEGKVQFRATCASCHTLAAVNARGVTGPNLDQIGAVDRKRVLSAIKIGGTGKNRMPKSLLRGGDAQAVAAYVAAVAGKTQ